MAGSLNRATLIGNLGRDPEIRSTQAGGRIANLAVATSETWTDKRSGERQERTEWHRVVVYSDHLVGVVEQYVRKGSKVMVEGAIKTRKCTDNAGVERYTTEITLGQFDGRLLLLGDPRGAGEGNSGRAAAPPAASPAPRDRGDLDDEIPF